MTDLQTVVAVLTYRRPADLAALLPQLVEQARSVRAQGGSSTCRLLVVDNDTTDSARELVAAAAGQGVRVDYVHEPRPGIAAARNRALDEAADADLLVFVDDDERPCAGWLAALLATRAGTGAAGVVGPVVSEFEVEPEPWLAAGRFFDRNRWATGTRVEVAATNNLLLDLRQVRPLGLRFDERFGLTGGSDTLFTRRLVALGGELVWCDEALVVDRVPADRLTRDWVLRRAYRSGNSWALTSLDLAGRAPAGAGRVRLGLVREGLVRALGGGAQALAGTLLGSAAHGARGRRTFARGSGMLAGAVGRSYAEYARSAA